MAFRLQKGESLDAGFRRLLLRDFERSREELTGEGDLEDRIHKVRVRLKRDRTILRAWRGPARAPARAAIFKLRDAAHLLAALRESHALAAAAQTLAAAGEEYLFHAAVESVPTPALRRSLSTAARLIGQAAIAVGELPPLDDDHAFARAARRTHRHIGRAIAKAETSSATEDLHELRKRLKDYLFLLRVGEERIDGAGRLAARTKEAEQALGDDHDLALLGQRLMAASDGDPHRLVAAAAISTRRTELQRKALRLARKIERVAPPV